MLTRQVEHRLEGRIWCVLECGQSMTKSGRRGSHAGDQSARSVVKEKVYYAPACRSCNQDNIETLVVKVPRERNIISGSFATPETIIHIMTKNLSWAHPCTSRDEAQSVRRNS